MARVNRPKSFVPTEPTEGPLPASHLLSRMRRSKIIAPGSGGALVADGPHSSSVLEDHFMNDIAPESAHDEFRERFNAGDLDGLLDLYEDAAVLVDADGNSETGKAAIRAAMEGFLAVGGDLSLETRYTARNGDLALLSNEWRLTGTGPDGQAVDMGGRTTEVVRRQPDGRWLYIIDHPWGAQ